MNHRNFRRPFTVAGASSSSLTSLGNACMAATDVPSDADKMQEGGKEDGEQA